MADPNCKICGGGGWRRKDETTRLQCPCEWGQSISKHLGPDLASAKKTLTSPLYEVKDKEIVADLTSKNLFIEASWNTARSHMKWALANKGIAFSFKILTDEMLVNVFIGNMSHKAMISTGRGDDSDYIFNSLDDIVGLANLVILRFGFLGYPNKAAAGTVLQALRIREAKMLPSWLISTPDSSFEGSHSYSLELAEYIERRFRRTSLDSTAAPPDEPRERKEDPSPGISIDEEEISSPPPRPSRLAVSSVIDDSQLGDGSQKPKKKSYSKKKGSTPDDGLPDV